MPPRERRTSRPPMNTSRLFAGGGESGENDLDYLLAGNATETAARANERGLPIRQLSVEAVAPDPHQLRRLPHPDELLQRKGYGDATIAGLLESLRALGRSIREQGQIQPVIVYADTDEGNPAVTHRLLHGQRRWTATVLEGLPTIWAIEVPRPNNVERLLRQFDENEQREDFTDMERAWAIVSLRKALKAAHGSEVPWTEVEARLGLSDSRRRDLLRLLRLAPDGQDLALRYRWSEWTLRPLHMAINAGEIDEDTATGILVELARDGEEVTAPVVAAAVAAQLGLQDEVMESFQTVFDRPGGQGATVSPSPDQGTLPSDTAGGASPSAPSRDHGGPRNQPAMRTGLITRLQKARREMEQVNSQAQGDLDAPTRAALMHEALALMQSLEHLVQNLGRLPGEESHP